MKNYTLFFLLNLSLVTSGQRIQKIISDLKIDDSVSFSVRRIDCIASDTEQIPDYFKLTRTVDGYCLYYKHFGVKPKKINLNSGEISFIKRIETSTIISSSYDVYSLTKRKKHYEFNVYYFYTDTLRQFFKNNK